MLYAGDCDLEVLTQEDTQKLQAVLKVWDALWIEDKPRENQGHVLVQTWETLPANSQSYFLLIPSWKVYLNPAT